MGHSEYKWFEKNAEFILEFTFENTRPNIDTENRVSLDNIL